jgi:hypothetical protein
MGQGRAAHVTASIIAVLGTLVGVALGALLPALLDSRRAAQARYDKALTAVARLQAARHGAGLNISDHYLGATDASAAAAARQRLSEAGVQRFLDAAHEARAALAELYPWSPELRQYWDAFEVSDSSLDEVTSTFVKRRQRPTRTYRLIDPLTQETA